jgi:hypothetical protein
VGNDKGSRPRLSPFATPWLKRKQEAPGSFRKTLLLCHTTTNERMHHEATGSCTALPAARDLSENAEKRLHTQTVANPFVPAGVSQFIAENFRSSAN